MTLFIGTVATSSGTSYFTGTEDPLTGIINGSTTVFTFTHSPKELVSDSATYVPGKGYTVSGSGPYTVTMDIAPQWALTSFY